MAGIIKLIFKATLILIICLISILAFLIFWMSIGVFSNQTFDREEWLSPQTNETASNCYRGGMAMYIKKILLKNKMSRNEIIGSLGKPDSEETNHIEYLLGMCSGFQMDYDGLIIRFDKNDNFTEAFIVQH